MFVREKRLCVVVGVVKGWSGFMRVWSEGEGACGFKDVRQ